MQGGKLDRSEVDSLCQYLFGTERLDTPIKTPQRKLILRGAAVKPCT